MEDSASDAAIRELKEELDVDINISRYLECNISAEDDTLLKYHLFLVSITSGSPKLMKDKFDGMNDLSSNKKMLVKKL